MINLKASKKTPTITVGVNPVTNIHVAEARSSTNVHYPGPDGVQESTAQVVERTVTVEDDKNALLRENKVLRIIIDILHSNPLIVNKYIIADDQLLVEIIRLLCNADDVQLDADDLGEGCITRNRYRKVNSIYVVIDGKTQNLKYDFPAVMKTLKDLHISTKYVW
mgnify:CR=1 FL=1|jgi:hypothetical protein